MSKIVPRQNKEANTLDLMRAHVLEGKRLPDRLKERFTQLQEIWALVLKNGRAAGVKFFAKRHGINITSTYPIIRQAMELFGDVLENDKEGERQILLDRLDQVWKKAMKEKDFTAANKALETRMKILQLDSDSNVAQPRPLPTTIIFTHDPTALQQPQVEDVPYAEEGLSK
jgi:hypothetical protein